MGESGDLIGSTAGRLVRDGPSDGRFGKSLQRKKKEILAKGRKIRRLDSRGRSLSMIQSRRISAACSVVDEGLSDVECLAELDSHADTCAFGSNCYILKDWDVMMTVDPFLPSLGLAQNVKVVPWWLFSVVPSI